MKILNQNKIDEVKRAMAGNLSEWGASDWDNNDLFCEALFNYIVDTSCREYKGIGFINEGSCRAAYRICNTNVVVKVDLNAYDYPELYKTGRSFQSAVEYFMFANTGFGDSMAEVYGASDNFIMEFCELCTDGVTYEVFSKFYPNKAEEIYASCSSVYIDKEDFLSNEISCCDAHFLTDELFPDFDDMHSENIGVNIDGEIKVLDAGWGTKAICLEVFNELLAQGGIVIGGAADRICYLNEELYEKSVENGSLWID